MATSRSPGESTQGCLLSGVYPRQDILTAREAQSSGSQVGTALVFTHNSLRSPEIKLTWPFQDGRTLFNKGTDGALSCLAAIAFMHGKHVTAGLQSDRTNVSPRSAHKLSEEIS